MTAAGAPRAGARRHRGTIFVEDARILAADTFPDEQYVLRIAAERCAASAEPGSFVHVRCDHLIPMRRPLSIMRADPGEGWIEILFKTIGEGLRALSHKRVGETVNVIGPIGRPFSLAGSRPRALLIGGGVGIPPMIFLAERLALKRRHRDTLVLMGSEIPFPFDVARSGLATPWLPDAVDRTMPLLESMRITARLASLSDFAGTYRGYVTELAQLYLASLAPGELAQTAVYACGPTAMLEAAARIAADLDLPAQVSLEEFMACAVGGCAGCAVRVETPAGSAMQRVCVDGPVFDAAAVFPRESAPVQDR